MFHHGLLFVFGKEGEEDARGVEGSKGGLEESGDKRSKGTREAEGGRYAWKASQEELDIMEQAGRQAGRYVIRMDYGNGGI